MGVHRFSRVVVGVHRFSEATEQIITALLCVDRPITREPSIGDSFSAPMPFDLPVSAGRRDAELLSRSNVRLVVLALHRQS